MKRIVILIFLMFLTMDGVFSKPSGVFEIDASKNASLHNNIGVNYLNEKNYYAAIKEFEIAIMINPTSQASANYYNNLGKTYMKIGYPNLAEKSFNDALKLNSMNFEFYQNIVESYKAQGKLNSELKKFLNSENPSYRVMAGLILVESGKLEAGINMLDEFCFDEPEMILSKGVRSYIQTIAPNDFR